MIAWKMERSDNIGRRGGRFNVGELRSDDGRERERVRERERCRVVV